MHPIVLIAFGVFVGIFSGLMGLGGGAVMIPIMVMLLGFEQAKAHGMSLMVMIPPVTLPAVLGYWKNGYLQPKDLWIAALIALGVAGGSYFGSQLADYFQRHRDLLKLVFGFVLIYVAAYTAFSWLGKEQLTRTVLMATIVTAFAVGLFLAVRWWDYTPAPTPPVT
jgi:uncharacterized membrane protein YfcA